MQLSGYSFHPVWGAILFYTILEPDTLRFLSFFGCLVCQVNKSLTVKESYYTHLIGAFLSFNCAGL
jgi:hypothetical protein